MIERERKFLDPKARLIILVCSDDSIVGHPRFYDLTKLLDKAVSRLLLRPTPSDVNLDSICVLLLYAQWMPCSKEGEDEDSLRPSTYDEPQTKSRYNEISAWVVLGLAERYSALLGLEQSATSLFKPPDKVPSIEDVKKLRVWYNLLTCNFNLMLTSGLPASIDPTPSVQVAWRFVSHELMQSPADLRVRGLVELVGIVHLAMSSSGDISGRRLQPSCLQRLNSDLDDWERQVNLPGVIFGLTDGSQILVFSFRCVHLASYPHSN